MLYVQGVYAQAGHPHAVVRREGEPSHPGALRRSTPDTAITHSTNPPSGHGRTLQLPSSPIRQSHYVPHSPSGGGRIGSRRWHMGRSQTLVFLLFRRGHGGGHSLPLWHHSDTGGPWPERNFLVRDARRDRSASTLSNSTGIGSLWTSACALTLPPLAGLDPPPR